MASATKAEAAAAVSVVLAVSEIVRTAQSIPSGELYARLMERGMTLAAYETIIRTLTNARLVEVKMHVVRWIGPEISG